MKNLPGCPCSHQSCLPSCGCPVWEQSNHAFSLSSHPSTTRNTNGARPLAAITSPAVDEDACMHAFLGGHSRSWIHPESVLISLSFIRPLEVQS